MAANFYRQKDGPRYILGHGLELGFICVGIIAALVLVLGYTRINKRREARMNQGDVNRYTAEELSAKGDKALTWRYML
jgi:hypothetical protein